MKDDHVVMIMAAGMGKRMKSNIPKVLHNFNKKPMLVNIIETSYKTNPIKIILIVGKFKELIEKTINIYLNKNILNLIEFAIQPEALGTGSAIKCGINNIIENVPDNAQILILSGDTPLINHITLNSLLENNSAAKILVTKIEDPYGYGRVFLDSKNNFEKIIEHKDCNEIELKNNLINGGIYSINFALLRTYIHLISNNNAQKEYYLTDLFEILINHKYIVEIYEIEQKKNYEILGVNTPEQLKDLHKYIL